MPSARHRTPKIVFRAEKAPAWVSPDAGLSTIVAYAGREEIGRIHLKDHRDFLAVTWINVEPKYQRQGIATRLYAAAAKASCAKRPARPLASDRWMDRKAVPDAFWRKQVAKGRAEARGDRIFLSCPPPASLAGLPARGRIPMSQVQRAMKALGRKVQKCRITPALLREGMEVEREHRDVTGLAVGKTARIAAAHICERRDYYKRIKRYVEPRR